MADNSKRDLLFQLVAGGRLMELQSLVNNSRVGKRKRQELINAVDDDGWGFRYFLSLGNESVIRYLRNAGVQASEDSRFVTRLDRWTVLHIAAYFCQEDIIRWLLSDSGGRAAGFKNILTKTSAGETALHIAARQGHISCIQAIVQGSKIENGERVELLNTVDSDKLTILHAAAREGQESVVRWLLSDSGGRAIGFNSVLALDKDDRNTFAIATHRGHLTTVIAIAEGIKMENGEREELLRSLPEILRLAACKGHEPLVRWLLSESGGRAQGIQCNTAKQLTPAFHAAAGYGPLSCMLAVLEGCKPEEREELINATGDTGTTVLHIATIHDQEEIIRWLLSDSGGRAAGFKSALARSKKSGKTALHDARGDLAAVLAVLEGCTPDERVELLNAVDSEGVTVLHWATISRTFIFEWLLSDSGGRAAGLKSSTITATEAKDGASLLHFAVEFGTIDVIQAVLSGCTVGERLTLFFSVDKHGWSVLHHAARFGCTDVILMLLLHHPETKTIVNHRDHRGMTALHRAVLNGGFDAKSRNEWREFQRVDEKTRMRVIEALLTFTPIDDAAENDPQAARIDVNLGLKIE